MQLTVMVTHGGPHPAEKWADRTANDIVQIADDVADDIKAAAYALRAELIAVLMGEHARVQEEERRCLADDHEHLVTKLDPAEHAARAVEKVLDKGMASSWGEHFKRPEVRHHVHQTLHQHFGSSMDIERSWHADRNPHTEAAKAYRAARDAHGPHMVHNTQHWYRPGGDLDPAKDLDPTNKMGK